MGVERVVVSAALDEVLERVLGKGVVVEVAEGSARVSVLGLELIGVDWRVTVASVEMLPSGAVRVASVARARAEEQTDEPRPRALLPPSRAPRRKRTPRRKPTALKPRPGENPPSQHP